MRVIKRGALVQFWEQHPDAKASLESWYGVARRAAWQTPAEMKQIYHNADLVGRRTIFNMHPEQVPTDRQGKLSDPTNIRFVHSDARGI
jgi:mRNA-degrading endonuclease HigB of HigAB toxin-antitoxin module